MFIIIIMPIHFENESRKALTRFSLERLTRQSISVHPLLVGSTQEEHQFAQEMDCFYTYQENIPLSKKYQRGVYYARGLHPDAIMILDSDTWISNHYCETALKSLQDEQIDVIGKNCFQILDIDSWVIATQFYQQFNVHEPTGTGRMFLAHSLDKLDWRLFPDRTPPEKLEVASLDQCKNAGLQIEIMNNKQTNVFILELRSSKWTSIQDWEIIQKYPTSILYKEQDIQHAKTWIDAHFPGGVEALKSL